MAAFGVLENGREVMAVFHGEFGCSKSMAS